MPLNPVNVGTAANNGTGDPLRLAFQKTNANDAYLKTYIDNLIQGLKWKQRVDAATTGNITLSGEQSIDGVTTITSRVLVKDQTDKTENGIYITGAGAWARSTDADEGEELVNATVSVVSGTVNANTNWTCNVQEITLGVTEIVFVAFEGASGVDQGTFEAAVQLINDTIDALEARVTTLENNPVPVQSVVAGTNVTIDNTDPQNPIVSSTATGGASYDDTAITQRVSDLEADLLTPVPAGAVFTDTIYTHPATHPPSIIEQDTNNRFVTDAEKATWNSGTGGGTAVERTIKTISNTSQYTLVEADFTDFILDFTANGGQNIAVILNSGVAPLNGQIQAISSGNNTLTPTVGSGTGSSTYSITIDSPTEGQEFTEGDTITVTGTVTETPSAGTVEFIFPENTNPITTGLNAWIGGVVLSADKVSWNGNFESTETGYDDTALAARVTDLEEAEPLKEHQINGTRIDNAAVTGSYEIDYNAGSLWVLTLVGATTLTEANIPTGSNTKPIELEINGNFALTLPARWVAKPSNDDYLGTVKNSFLVSSHTATRAVYSLENLA